jgi:hypothetical protein
MRKGLSDLLGKHPDFKVFITFIVLSFALAWLPDGISEWWDGHNTKGIIMLIISIVILIGIYILFIYLMRKYDKEEVAEISLTKARPKNALILFLSDHPKIKEIKIPQTLSQTGLAKNQWDQNLGNWQIPLTAIHFHASRLERCVVLTSPESDKQIETFKKIVRNLFGDGVIIETRKIETIDDPRMIIDGYRQAFRRLKNIEKFPENEIVIDVTSGTKLVTIAGSFYALAKDRLIEYVDGDYTVKMFNNHAIPD